MHLHSAQAVAVPTPRPIETDQVPEHGASSGALRSALVVVTAWRVVLAVAGVTAYYVMPRGSFSPVSLVRHGPLPVNPFTLLIDAGVRSDAVWYGRIVQNGYSYSTVRPSGIAFYPLYPALIKPFALILGNAWVAGMLVSTLCLIAAVVLLWMWMNTRGLGVAAPRAVLALLLFPWSLFFAAMYSESLYLLLAIATFLAAERRLWPVAAITALLLGLCRPTGVLIVPCLALLIWAGRDRRNSLAWLSAVAPVAGFLGFSMYQWIAFGTPLANERAEAVSPWLRSFHQGFLDLTLHSRPGVPGWFLAGLLLIGLGILATVPRVYRRLGAPYALYTGLSVVVPASTGLISLERFVIVDFPVFVVFGLTRLRARTVVLMAVQFWLLVLFTMAFESGWAVW